MEGHSDSEGRLEEYFGERRPIPMRRSPRTRQGQQQPPRVEEGVRPDVDPLTADMECAWIKLKEGVPMRVWYVRQGAQQAVYGADGSKEELSRQELARREVPYAYVQRHEKAAIRVARCMHRAITKKFKEHIQTKPLPSAEEWMDWLKPLSTSMHIEFACQDCGARCKTFNRYAQWVDGAERLGGASCDLFGKFCSGKDMQIPEALDHTRLEERIMPIATGISPTSTQLEEGMQTARERKDEVVNINKDIQPKRRIRRPRRTTRFTPQPARRILRRRRTSTSAIPSGITNKLPESPKAIPTPTRPPAVPPLTTTFQWDEEPSLTTPPPLTPLSSAYTAQDSIKREVALQMEGLAANITKQLLEQQQRQTPRIKEITEDKDKEEKKDSNIFSTAELEELRITVDSNTQAQHTTMEKAEKWVRDLRADKIKPMAKAMGRVVAASTYAGEPHPIAFAAWCDSIRSLMAMYDIPQGSSQVQVATWFITGPVKTWWDGICASKGYGDMTNLDDFIEAVRTEFQPQDAAEQCIDKWCTLKQTHTVTQYMNEVDALHNTWRLCEKAEFGLAMRGLKKELKGVIRRAMNDQKRKWMSLKELRVLAMSAEIEKYDPPAHKSLVFAPRTQVYPRILPKTPLPKPPALTMGALELRHPKKDNTPMVYAKTQPVYRCGVCGMKNHLTTLCIHRKKEGCWRCGGKHLLKDCRAPYTRYNNAIPSRTASNNEEEARNAVLARVTSHTHPNFIMDLAYPVRVNASPIVAIATLDTGAQCSAIRLDVAKAAGIDWNPIPGNGSLRGVSGEPLNVYGKARTCIQAGGLTSSLDAWIVEGIKPQIILGLPWIQHMQPQVDWGNASSLVFPNGSKWTTEETTKELLVAEEAKEQEYNNNGSVIQGIHDQGAQEEPTIQVAKWMEELLKKYSNLFTPLSGVPPDERVRHAIKLTHGARPVMKRPYRLSDAQKKDAEEQIRNAMKEGWIQPSTSAWGTAILMVPKKEGTWRMCVDYRDLNALTIADAYPLPRIDDLLHRLGTAKFFSKLDLQSGYHQIWIEPEDRHKTAFRINEPVDGHCHFEWKVMPFGLKNAPPTFQRYMTLVMNTCADCCLVYMDDLLVFSNTQEEHLQHVTRVFDALTVAQLKVKMSKCVFGVTSVDFLGHTISQGLIEMDTSKKQAILRWESPLTSAKEVRQFMGIVSYYRNFIPRLSTLAEPLTRMTRKRIRLEWGWEAQQAMEDIKSAIVEAQSLTVWDPQLATRVTTDASTVGMGAILEQLHDVNEWRITSSWSRKLTPCQQRYSTTDREWLAAVECITRVWRHWLLGKEFELRTDHAALREILTRKGEEFSYRQLRWYERLEPYSFTVTYIKGKDNVIPDALSRTPLFYDVKAIEFLPSTPHAMIDTHTLQEAMNNDDKYKTLCHNESLCEKLKLKCNENGLLETSQGQICVPPNDILRYKIVLEAHEPLFAGHFSERKTLEVVKRHWWWPHMNNTVQRVVGCCPVCQCDATKKQRDEGPYKPLVAGAPWEVITVDFVSGFTPSIRSRHTACCVVCDRFTRMIHLESCRDHATAHEAVGMMLRMVISRHGCPRLVISDRGTQFDSELWTQVWKMLGTRVAMASTHHPQTNGLTERCNRTLISLIRKYAHDNPKRWAEFLPLFEFAYNNTVHSTTQVAPFVAEKGYNPPMPVSLLTTEMNITSPQPAHMHTHVVKLKRVIMRIWKMIQQHEQRARQQITERENKRRGNPQYSTGDEVLVYWPPFRAYTDIARKHRMRYIGPFTVVRMIEDNAVELEGLPERMPRVINTEYVHPYKRDDDEQLRQLRQSPQPPRPSD